MRFLDGATNASGDERWNSYLGLNRVARECGVHVLLTNPCEDTSGDVIGDDESRAGSYETIPWAFEARLYRTVACELPDDEKWLRAGLDDYNEVVLSRALVLQATTGTDSYTGHADVKTVTLAGSTDTNLADGAAAGRKKWTEEVFGAGPAPIMHVPPLLAPALKRGGVLDDSDKNIWGDKVIIAGGYDSGTPRIFFTGPVKYYLSGIEDGPGTARLPRTNDSLISLNELAMIDVPPCTIVRVGSYS